jgi:CHAD domain-containing protein
MVTKLDEIFAGQPEIATVLGPDHQALRATYYDTDDLRLYRAGITVRRHTGGDDAGWQAALPVGPGRHRELRAPLATSDNGVPRELAGLLPAYVGGRTLSPCAHVATERERWQLVDDRGALLAAVVLDSVRAQALGRSRTIQVWQEIELEPAEGGPELLETVSKRLDRAGLPRSADTSALARALGRKPRRARKPPGRKATAGAVLTAYLRAQLDALRAADIALRLGEPDGVHDMRVSVRRLRSCLRVFGNCFDRAGIRTVKAELKWLSDLLGAARDAEVLRRTISGRLGEIPDELLLGPVFAEVDRALARPEATVDAELRTCLAGNRYLALINSLDQLVDQPPLRARADRRAEAVLPRRVRRSYRKVRTAVARTEAQPDQRARADALHSVRKKVKRLRYACEAVEPVVGKPARKVAKRAKRVQSTLGAHHDNVVLGGTLRELGARGQLADSNGFTFGLLLGQARERAAAQEHVFSDRWRRLAKRRARRWMG